jgi:hypothetical protein
VNYVILSSGCVCRIFYTFLTTGATVIIFRKFKPFISLRANYPTFLWFSLFGITLIFKCKLYLTIINCSMQLLYAGIDLCIMTSQGLMPARNAGLSSHRPGKLNNSRWPLSKFSRAMTAKTSISRGHQAL